ncbi:hypothetical protein VINE108521_12265 [Vibrio neonatus]
MTNESLTRNRPKYYKRSNLSPCGVAAELTTNLTIPEFCRQLNGVNTQKVQRALAKLRVLINLNNGYEPDFYYNVHFKVRSFEYKPGKHRSCCFITEVGAGLLYKLYLDDFLPMRKDWDGNYSVTPLEPTPPYSRNIHQQ